MCTYLLQHQHRAAPSLEVGQPSCEGQALLTLAPANASFGFSIKHLLLLGHLASDALDNGMPKSKVGYKMSVHHVQVKVVCALMINTHIVKTYYRNFLK